MARRAGKAPSAPFDIFGDERLDAAMTAATAAVDAPEQAKGGRRKTKESGTAKPPGQKPNGAAGERPAVRETEPTTPESVPAPVIEENVPLKFQVPRSMRSAFQAFKAELGAALGGVMLDDSNLGRALLHRLLEVERERILDAARPKAGALKRPKNGDLEAMAAFDEAIRELFEPQRR